MLDSYSEPHQTICATKPRAAEKPASWTVKLREIFEDETEVAKQNEITAQEEMRFGERHRDDPGYGLSRD